MLLLEEENRILRERIRYLEGIIDDIPINVYWKNLKGENLGCNKHALNILNLPSLKDYVGKTVYDLLDKSAADRVVSIDGEVMHLNQSKITEEQGYDAMGKEAVYLTHKIPIHDEKGEVIGVLGASIDITERKNMEAKLREAEAKIAAEKAKVKSMQAMAAGIAHDMRTPLGSISSTAGGVRKYLPKFIEAYEMADEAGLDVPIIKSSHMALLKNSMTHIKDEVDYANSIINMMLMGVKEGKIPDDNFAVISMSEAIQNALNLYSYRTPDEEALVHFDSANDFEFWGKQDVLGNVIMNMMKNSFHFIAKAQKGDIYIWLENKVDHNELHFKDTATGMSKNVLSHIFEDFYTNREGGTGIGLTFCQKAMAAFKGKLDCNSVESEFTEFVMTFPKAIEGIDQYDR